jgi:hypothetical protein
MSRSKRFFIALTVVSASFMSAAEALAFSATNHNETLLGEAL